MHEQRDALTWASTGWNNTPQMFFILLAELYNSFDGDMKAAEASYPVSKPIFNEVWTSNTALTQL